MAKSEVWRKIDGAAIQCTECKHNVETVLYANENPVGVDYSCDAEKGICMFLHKKPDNDRWYADFHDVYEEVK